MVSFGSGAALDESSIMGTYAGRKAGLTGIYDDDL